MFSNRDNSGEGLGWSKLAKKGQSKFVSKKKRLFGRSASWISFEVFVSYCIRFTKNYYRASDNII